VPGDASMPTSLFHLTSFAPSPPGALKFMAGRKPTGKQVRSWLALEALAVSEGVEVEGASEGVEVEGAGVGSLWELMLLPMTFEELEPPDA